MAEVKSITESDLKTCLNDCVFTQLSSSPDKYIFISKTSKKCLKNYKKESSLENSRLLWKNLLIDAICVLKVNDKREKIYIDSKHNTSLFHEHFDNIRKSNTYGIDQLDKYFDDFIDFESVLYGSDKHYRDHVGHVLQVWAIGIGLLNKNEFIFKDGYKLESTIDFQFEYEGEQETFITRSEIWSMWTIIALCHDLGYPIEKTSEINKQAKKIISHFGNMNFSELNYSFDIFNSFLVDKFLNIVSSKANIKDQCTTIQTKYRDKISKSLEDYKHGVFSSLLIFKNLTYFLETDFSISEQKLSEEDLRQFFIRKEVLRAISSHTCSKIYHLEFNTLSFLLILCDELQEWNRPKFNEIRNEVKSLSPESVELKEFSMTTDQRIKIEFVYAFKSNESHIEYLVKSKFRSICHLLRHAKDDGRRKMIFDWDIIFEDRKFNISFDSSRSSYEFVKTSIFDKDNEDNWNISMEKLELY